MRFKTYICLFLITCSLTAFGQERLLNKANEDYQNYSFTPAIDIYQRVLEKGYQSADLLKRLGNSYYYNAEYAEAAGVYGKLIGIYGDSTAIEPGYYFRYAQSLLAEGNEKKAKEILETFKSMTATDSRSWNADPVAQIKENSGRYELGPFEYNSAYTDFAPAFYKEGLIFSSDRDTGNFARYRHTWNAKAFLDLYKVNADSASYRKPVKLETINSRWHESTSALSKGGDTLYFTRNNVKDGKFVKDEQGTVRLKIFRSYRTEEGWSQPEDLPFNSDRYSTAHPAIDPSGEYLYFASDMPGTMGLSDLFRVRLLPDGSMSTPENLGSDVNTDQRETFPFVSEENVLYFSSDGHVGLGGLDVFATTLNGSTAAKGVQNVGAPVNSEKDDFTFIFVEGTRKGYFASNRDGGMGLDDIYSFVETRPLKLECLQQLSGTVRDKISNEILAGATVKVIDESNSELDAAITGEEGTYELTCNCNQGNFVRASMQGYIPAEEYLSRSEGNPRIIDFYLEPETLSAGFGDDLAKLLQLSTIYFDFDRYTIRPDAEVEVQKVIAAMEKYPSLKLQVNSHTDSRGPDAYNLWLSKKRAEATVQYMIDKGIDPDRLRWEGYGETRLVNKCSNGVSCSDEEHEMNRRSEFIILQ